MKKKITRLLLVAFVLGSILEGCADLSEKSGASIAAYDSGKPIPVLSDDAPELDVATAYRIQKRYVSERLKQDKIGGFKGGLTSKAAMEKFGVYSPLVGVLFESGRHLGPTTIKSADFKKPMIETEIGFIVAESIATPVADFSELRPKIKAIAPVIEIPDLGFSDMKRLKGVDIIAANVASAQYIIGSMRSFELEALNDIAVVLKKDGETVNRGKGSDTLGDQKTAVVWLANSIVEQGYQILPGQVLITGAMGIIVPGEKGLYVADYGNDLGKLSFGIE